ncbi:MAG: ammonium transporter [Pirellulales bacterium]
MLCLMAAPAWGQADAGPTDATTTVDAAEPAAEAVVNNADNAWILVSSALVLMMTAPGLAMFYSGLVRKKDVLGVMMQCVFLMGLNSVIWAIYGYSLSFGGNPDPKAQDASYSPWIGNGEYLFLQNAVPEFNEVTGTVDYPPVVGTIPVLTHMLFQGMFFIITPALICGAFAERMKFSAMVVFTILWGTVVYCPLCHWVWDGGLLAYGSPHASPQMGALDFAGGTVVHISSGVSALVCALVLGKRLGFGSEPMPPHNLTYTTIGAALLWVGWFGFNAGSALSAGNLAASAFAATHLSAAAGTLAWAGLEWIIRGKPSVLGACSGAVAGLVCITPASGFVQPVASMLIGLAGGAVCYFACTTLKHKFKYDDSLDAFGVHGVGGTLGAVLTGVFATRNVADPAISGGSLLGLTEGGKVLLPQIVATLTTWALAIVATFVILKLIDAVIGLRVKQEQEVAGLDLSQHGEEGYIFM